MVQIAIGYGGEREDVGGLQFGVGVNSNGAHVKEKRGKCPENRACTVGVTNGAQEGIAVKG